MNKIGCSIFYFILLSVLGACTTIPVEERATIRKEINAAAEETIAALVTKDPTLQKLLDTSVGYCTAQISSTTIVVVGGGYGLGVCFDNERATRTYVNINRYDVGAGLGASKYRALLIFNDSEVLREFTGGTWTSAVGSQSSAGEKGGAAATAGKGYSAHFLSEAGALLAVTGRVVSTSINQDLTDTGISAVSVPNTGFVVADRQVDNAPRQWDHKLPFLAQKVIDEGYDLPLPYGVGVTYANVKQDMILGELDVGLDGGAQEPFEFVAFENASAESETLQLKLDTWLFPFMNVFAMVGKLDGKAPLDVVLDGNGMLDQIGADCSGLPPSPLCLLLQDRTIVLPIKAPFSGTTYGLGTILAGGWNNWFVTIPFNVTYADMDTTETDGLAYTLTPRVGRVLNLGRNGNLALFAGGNYLKAELTVVGRVFLPVPGDDPLQVDYTIEQENTDPWNLVVGGNWDINKHWSVSAEYNGFIGSRDAYIGLITRRF